MNIHDHAGRPVEHIRNQEILGRRKDLGFKTDGLYEALEGVAHRLVVIHDGNDRNLVTYVSHGPVIFFSDKQIFPVSSLNLWFQGNFLSTLQPNNSSFLNDAGADWF